MYKFYKRKVFSFSNGIIGRFVRASVEAFLNEDEENSIGTSCE